MIGSLGDDGKRLCPLCLKDFNLWECPVVSGKNPDKVLKPAPGSRLAKLLRHVMHSEALVGKEIVQELASWKCPHCRNLLPYNIDRADSKIITVVGDTGSGKSHFLAVLIRDLEDGLLLPRGREARFECLTLDSKQKYVEYLKSLKSKKSLEPTPPATEDEPYKPLIYEMVIRESPLHPPRVWNLVFYDAAGEDYANPERMVEFCRYVLEANAIIFLADPVSMPMIYDRLPSHLQNQLFTGRRASAVFTSVLRRFEQSKGMGPASVPIAITLSKSDLLKYLAGINQYYAFSSHPKHGYGNGIDLKDMETVDAEVRDLLDEYGGRPLLSATQGLNVKFFAVSATGHAPKADGTYAAVDPRRCLDPVLWVLYKLGIVDAK